MANATPVRELNIDRLRMEIRLHYPGFAILAGMTEWSETSDMPTACTNGKWVKLNPDFMGKWNFKSQVFVVLHELIHIVRKHMVLRGQRDPELFNIAADHYINLLLKKTCGDRASMPQENGKDFGYADNRFDGMSEFEIYDILKQEQDAGGDAGKGGNGIGEVTDLQAGEGEGEQMSQKQVDKLVHEINTAIQTAEAVGKMSGRGSSIWEQLAGELREPVIKWESVLRRFMTRVFPAYRGWSQLDRRMYSVGIAYPATVKTGTQELVFGVDCSGSMPRDVVERALAETVSAMQQCHVVKMHVIYFCDGVEAHDTYTANNTPKIREDLPCGGTNLQSFMDYVAKDCPSAKGIICMTDGDFGHWPENPTTPVIWGMTPRNLQQYPIPFGEVFQIPDEK